MGHNHGNLLQYVYSIYKQLSYLQEQQLQLLETNEVNWAAITSLIEQRDVLSRSVDGLITQQHYENWHQDINSKVIVSHMEQIIVEMLERSHYIECKIMGIKSGTSNDLQDTKAHRTVLHAYGGLDRPNIDSIYLDQKK